MYKVYVLKSVKFPKSYVGLTNDIDRRLKQHNEGRHFYTKRYLPWIVVYTEDYDTVGNARKRELYFKSAAGRRFLRKYVFES